MEKTKNKKQEEEQEADYQNYKEDKYIEKLISEKKKVQINLSEGFVYSGFIVGMSGNSILFLDKFSQELIIWIRDIKRIIVLNGERRN